MFKFIVAAVLAYSPWALSTDAEVEAILAQAGCYHVTYESRETGTYDPNYKITSGYFRTGTTELVVPESVGENEIFLQHITQFQGVGENHWGQLWKRNPTEVFPYKANLTWAATPVEKPEGKWSQYVTQVDGSPRYDCAAKWKINGGVREWSCTSWAPLPRREYRRSDYNVLERGNRHIITRSGWIHHQENRKLRVENGVITPIATELTINTYERIADEKCVVAAEHWNRLGPMWQSIRSVWNQMIANNPEMKFQRVVNGKVLWQRLFEEVELQKKNPAPVAEFKEKMRRVIAEFLK